MAFGRLCALSLNEPLQDAFTAVNGKNLRIKSAAINRGGKISKNLCQ